MTQRVLIAAGGDLRRALVEQFAFAKDTDVAEADSAEGALDLLAAGPCDLLIVGGEVFVPLPEARARGFHAPAILLARAEDEPTLGDHYDAVLLRPFRFSRLFARIAALGARPDSGGVPPLTEKEAALLARLARARGAIVARETLLAEVWGYGSGVATHTLETHIHRLRRKLERAPRRRLQLKTAPGGYLLATDGGAADALELAAGRLNGH